MYKQRNALGTNNEALIAKITRNALHAIRYFPKFSQFYIVLYINKIKIDRLKTVQKLAKVKIRLSSLYIYILI